MHKVLIISGIAIAILGIGGVCAISVGSGQNPAKILDPNDPHYDPDQFSFDDHRGDRAGKIEYFRKLFPVGTPKAFVDRVLVDVGGASVLEIKEMPSGWHVWRYDEPWEKVGYPGGPAHTVIFDNAMNVENIKIFNTEYLHPENVTKENLRAIQKEN